MTPDKMLQLYLPGFLLASLFITFLWKWFRQIIRANYYPDIEKSANYNRIKRIEIIYLLIFFVFAIMITTYTFYHELYYVFIPLDYFDHPLINSFGLLILKASFIIVLIAQIHIDKELYKYSRNIDDLKAMELVHYSERMFLGGLSLMFIGLFVTLTNVVGILAGLLSLLFYLKVFYRLRMQK